MSRSAAVALLLAALSFSAPATAACPEMLQHSLRPLGKAESDAVNLCDRYAGRPLLIVNTASHCGFTPQFKGLEALHQAYSGRGLAVIGIPSDDFRQEADSETETAKICYVNYGVTFDMFAEQHVRGAEAHPLFRALAAETEAPGWNFNKYLVDREGKVVAHYGSTTAPDDADLRAAIEKLL